MNVISDHVEKWGVMMRLTVVGGKTQIKIIYEKSGNKCKCQRKLLQGVFKRNISVVSHYEFNYDREIKNKFDSSFVNDKPVEKSGVFWGLLKEKNTKHS